MPKVPKILYKYMSANTFGLFLENRSLRFTPANQLNDPYEVEPLIKGIVSDEALRVFLNNPQSQHHRYKRELDYIRTAHNGKYAKNIISMYNKYGKNINKIKDIYTLIGMKAVKEEKLHVCILSLSSLKNDILMWAHYGDNNKGCIIGLNTEIICSNIRKYIDFKEPTKVLYDRRKPNFFMYNINEYIEKSIITKSPCWKYEEEWRIISRSNSTYGLYLKLRNYLIMIDSDCISSVIIGDRYNGFGKKTKDEYIEYICNKIGISPDTVYISTRSISEYNINIIKYNDIKKDTMLYYRWINNL